MTKHFAQNPREDCQLGPNANCGGNCQRCGWNREEAERRRIRRETIGLTTIKIGENFQIEMLRIPKIAAEDRPKPAPREADVTPELDAKAKRCNMEELLDSRRSYDRPLAASKG